jgi:hypothetical protein
MKVTGSPEDEDALNENELPYCAFGRVAKLIVCDCRLEPVGRTMNVPDTEFAALNVVEPGCEAVTVQLPVPLRARVAEDTLAASAWLAIVHDPVVLKTTCSPFGTPLDIAVAVTAGELVIGTELGNGPSVIV